MTEHPTRTPEMVLREPSEQVSPRAVGYWRLSAVPSVVIALVAGGAVLVLGGAAWWAWVGAGALLVASLGVVLVMPGLRYRVHRWEVTHEAVYTRSGWLRRDVRIVPLSRVQTISTSQSAVMRAWGVAARGGTNPGAAGAGGGGGGGAPHAPPGGAAAGHDRVVGGGGAGGGPRRRTRPRGRRRPHPGHRGHRGGRDVTRP